MELSAFLESIKSLVIIIAFVWGIFTILNIFHSGLQIFWRIMLIFIYLLFVLFYYEILKNQFFLIIREPKNYFINILNEFIVFVGYLDIVLYILWPWLLIYTFFSIREKKSLEFIKKMILITLLYWLFIFAKDQPYIKNIYNTYIIKYIQK